MVEPVSLSLLAIGVLGGGAGGYFSGNLKSKLSLKKGINLGKAETELQYQQKIELQKQRIALYKEELDNLDQELHLYNQNLSIAKRQEYIIMALYAQSIYTAQQIGAITDEDKNDLNQLIMGAYGTFLSDEVKAKINKLYHMQLSPAQVSRALKTAHIDPNHLAIQYLNQTLVDPEFGLASARKVEIASDEPIDHPHPEKSKFQIPKMSMPKMPDLHLPDRAEIKKKLHLDDITLDNINMPKMPKMNMPDVQMPSGKQVKDKFKNVFNKKADQSDEKK